MTSAEASINLECNGAYRNGAYRKELMERNKKTLEKFEKSFSRINTPSWMRERIPQIKLPRTTTDEPQHNYSTPGSDSRPTTLTVEDEIDDDNSDNEESRENISESISRDSDSTTFNLLQNATKHVDKSSSTGRIRYSDYRRACAALAAAVKSRNATLSSNSGTTRPSCPPHHSYNRWLSNRRGRQPIDMLRPMSNPSMPQEEVLYHPQHHPPHYAMQRPYGYTRNMSRESSPAPPPFPPPPPPAPELLAPTDANNVPGLNYLPGSVAVGRWSTSTLCDSAYSGNNTPTDSVISECKSNASSRSFLHSSNTMRQKAYLGWRSQDNLLDSKLSTLSNDPTQRLAYTYKQGILSGRASASGAFSGGSRLASDSFGNIDGGMRSQSYSRSLPRNCFGSQLHELSYKPQQQQKDQQTELHESIKSVSSAIMEFCKAEDVPLPPPDDRTRRRHIRTKDQHQKARVVWMESSFVSGKDCGITSNSVEIQVTNTATTTCPSKAPA